MMINKSVSVSCLFFQFSELEGAESTLILASGMCASTVLLLALVPAGGHLVTTTDCYRKTRIFMETFLPKMGITVWILSFTCCCMCALGL
jgi:cystathionine gamma-synthase